MDVVVHAIGDKACDQAIKIISSLNNKYDRKSPNNAIIHAQILNKRQMDLLRINHINAIVQPIFINTDIKIISDRIGNRDKESYLFKTMSENINLGFSTDSPVETVNPFHNIYCAVTRKSIDFPEYQPFNLDEAFSLSDALKAYTDNNLGFVYEKESFDYIEIDKDIYNLDLEELKDVKVLKTFIDEKIVYERKK
jgi:predicted amidohydrolase YtcJ